MGFCFRCAVAALREVRFFSLGAFYVNDSHNLPNLKQVGKNRKSRLIEEEFMKRMYDAEGS